MLTFEQLQTIASILGWTTDEVSSAIGEINSGFMKIHVEFLTGSNLQEIIPDLEPDCIEPGFYSRLSAPGYLDCTDWDGPFETEEQAVASLLSMYAD